MEAMHCILSSSIEPSGIRYTVHREPEWQKATKATKATKERTHVMSPAEWLAILKQPEYCWQPWSETTTGATEEELEQLTAWFGKALPDDYAAFLRFVNGADIWHPAYGEIHIWPSSSIASHSSDINFTPENIQGAIAFADNGSEEVLVFDVRSEQSDGRYPVYSISYISVYDGWSSAIPVASSFEGLVLLRTDLLHAASDDQSGDADC